MNLTVTNNNTNEIVIKEKIFVTNTVDNEKEQAKIDFANYVCTPSRLEQAVQMTCDTLNGGIPEMKNMGDVIRAVIKDIIKEESDILFEKGLEPKEVNKYISNIVRDWYKIFLDKESGL